jgi:hypothetical protein
MNDTKPARQCYAALPHTRIACDWMHCWKDFSRIPRKAMARNNWPFAVNKIRHQGVTA